MKGSPNTDDYPKNELFRVKSLGSGFIVFRRDVFEMVNGFIDMSFFSKGSAKVVFHFITFFKL